jgi:hypothetical protein
MEIIASRQAPLINELNIILEQNNVLLAKLVRLQEVFETSTIDDLAPFIHKMQIEVSIIKDQISSNDRKIEDIQGNLQTIVKEYSLSFSVVGSIN